MKPSGTGMLKCSVFGDSPSLIAPRRPDLPTVTRGLSTVMILHYCYCCRLRIEYARGPKYRKPVSAEGAPVSDFTSFGALQE